MPAILYLLAACNLVIGTGAFGLAGILQPVSVAMDVSVAAVGQSMTVYAFATALLAPLLLLATGRWPRKAVLLLGLALFAAGTLVCALSTGLGGLLLGRVLMGAGAVFTPVAAGIAVALVPPERRGKALSLTFLGMSMSYVVGLPLTAWLGLQYGWRWPLFGVVGAALLALALVATTVPRHINAPGASFAGLGATLRNPEVVRTLVLTLLYFSAIFTVFAYIGPVLLALNPAQGSLLSLTLMLFGFAGMAGTLSGGWASDRFGARPTLKLQLAGFAAAMLLIPLTAGQLGRHGGGLHGVGHLRFRHDDAAADPAGRRGAGPGAAADEPEHLHAVFRHRNRRGRGRPGRQRLGLRLAAVAGRGVCPAGCADFRDNAQMTALDQLHSLRRALDGLRTGNGTIAAFSTTARQQAALIAALPPRYGEVLLQLLDRLESSALFSEESCSFSQKELFDSLQFWLDKAGGQLPADQD